MKTRVNGSLQKKIARVPFNSLPTVKTRFVKIKGKTTSVLFVEPNFEEDEYIELPKQIYDSVGENVDVEFFEKIPAASEITVTIHGPYRPSNPDKLLIGLPFVRGEEYKIYGYKIIINNSDEEIFTVESTTKIIHNFIPETSNQIDIMGDVYQKITRAIDVLTGGACPKGVIITGPPGSGKTYFLQKLISLAPRDFAAFFSAKDVRDGKKLITNFTKSVDEAIKENKKIIIDDLDEILQKCPYFSPILQSVFDNNDRSSTPVIIAAVREVSKIPDELLSPCRFGIHIKTRLPKLDERVKILRAMGVHNQEIAQELEGYTIGDIYKIITNIIIDDKPLEITTVRHYKKRIPPTSIMNYQMEIPNIHWDDIGGLEKVKKELQKVVEWPLKYPDLFKKMGINPPRGILLYGPPGTGKTLLAKAIATESGANFISVRAPEILDKYYGVSEARIREIFERARQSKPTIIFIDEIDAIGVRRGVSNHGIDSIINQLLIELDGITDNDGIVVIAATNRLDVLDPALLRPGRFEKIINVPLPNREARMEIFKIHLRNKPVSPDVKIEELSGYTEGITGAEIEAIVREAGYLALERSIKEGVHLEITMKDLLAAIQKTGGGYETGA